MKRIDYTMHILHTAKFFCEPPVALRSAYNCFNCSIPGAPMNITYGINSVLLCNIFNAFGAQSRTHIFPKFKRNGLVMKNSETKKKGAEIYLVW